MASSHVTPFSINHIGLLGLRVDFHDTLSVHLFLCPLVVVLDIVAPKDEVGPLSREHLTSNCF